MVNKFLIKFMNGESHILVTFHLLGSEWWFTHDFSLLLGLNKGALIHSFSCSSVIKIIVIIILVIWKTHILIRK